VCWWDTDRPAGDDAQENAMSTITGTPGQPTGPTPPPTPRPPRSAGRVALLIASSAMLACGGTMLVGGGGLVAADHHWRDGGYLSTDAEPLQADGYAIASEGLELGGVDEAWVLGRARVRAASSDGASPVFVGVARSADAARYLAGVEHSTVTEIDDPATTYEQHPGGAPAMDPADSDIWVAQSDGTGRQSVDWSLHRAGRWTVVVMNADGSAGVAVDADVGATVPVVKNVGLGLLAAGGLFSLLGAAGLVGVRLNRRGSAPEDLDAPPADHDQASA
jgi:hypothetical protein